jgi:hypothetical protein
MNFQQVNRNVVRWFAQNQRRRHIANGRALHPWLLYRMYDDPKSGPASVDRHRSGRSLRGLDSNFAVGRCEFDKTMADALPKFSCFVTQSSIWNTRTRRRLYNFASDVIQNWRWCLAHAKAPVNTWPYARTIAKPHTIADEADAAEFKVI